MRLEGRLALVTGASSGIGADFARALAARGAGLVLVARRRERLEALAAEIAAQHGTACHVVAQSLSEPGGAPAVYEAVRGLGLPVDVLVNNAGAGVFGEFKDVPWERQRELLELDVVAPTHLTRLFLPAMLERNAGWILQVSSIGAFLPTPGYATYSAAKAYLLSFGEALASELRGTSIRVSTLCPGVTETEFFDAAGQTRSLFQRLSVMSSADVAEAGLAALFAGRSSRVPGLLNAISMQGVRFVPRRAATGLAGFLMRFGAR